MLGLENAAFFMRSLFSIHPEFFLQIFNEAAVSYLCRDTCLKGGKRGCTV
jgi:hypothetical protein